MATQNAPNFHFQFFHLTYNCRNFNLSINFSFSRIIRVLKLDFQLKKFGYDEHFLDFLKENVRNFLLTPFKDLFKTCFFEHFLIKGSKWNFLLTPFKYLFKTRFFEHFIIKGNEWNFFGNPTKDLLLGNNFFVLI